MSSFRNIMVIESICGKSFYGNLLQFLFIQTFYSWIISNMLIYSLFKYAEFTVFKVVNNSIPNWPTFYFFFLFMMALENDLDHIFKIWNAIHSKFHQICQNNWNTEECVEIHNKSNVFEHLWCFLFIVFIYKHILIYNWHCKVSTGFSVIWRKSLWTGPKLYILLKKNALKLPNSWKKN